LVGGKYTEILPKNTCRETYHQALSKTGISEIFSSLKTVRGIYYYSSLQNVGMRITK